MLRRVGDSQAPDQTPDHGPFVFFPERHNVQVGIARHHIMLVGFAGFSSHCWHPGVVPTFSLVHQFEKKRPAGPESCDRRPVRNFPVNSPFKTGREWTDPASRRRESWSTAQPRGSSRGVHPARPLMQAEEFMVSSTHQPRPHGDSISAPSGPNGELTTRVWRVTIAFTRRPRRHRFARDSPRLESDRPARQRRNV